MTPEAKRKREVRAERRAKKLCVQCGAPAQFLAAYCGRCAEANTKRKRLKREGKLKWWATQTAWPKRKKA
jgi:predicted amidophosphoribosyltransferase